MPDTVVIGSGPGGYVAALRCAQMGQSVTIIEKEKIGGVCTNTGCIPTKTLLESAKLVRQIRKSSNHGIDISEMRIDFDRMMRRKDLVVSRNSKGVELMLEDNNVEIVRGKGFILNKKTVRVNNGGHSEELKTDFIIIATGSKERELPDIKIDGHTVLGSRHLLGMKQLPSSLLIIGGGAIGVEFAQIFSSLGTRVTIVELMNQILPMEDEGVGDLLAKILRRQGVDIYTGSKVEDLNVDNSGASARIAGRSTLEIEAEKVLLSIGREPVIEKDVIGPDVEYDETGIKVNEKMQTSVPTIYAVGDVTGKVLLAHVASRQAEVAANNICGFEDRMDYSLVPSCIYTSPEVASFGLRPEDAEKSYGKINVGTFSLIRSGRARTSGETEGFVRIVARYDTGEVVGAHIVAPRATDMLQILLLAKERGISISEIPKIMFPHPTYVEILKELAYEMEAKRSCKTD